MDGIRLRFIEQFHTITKCSGKFDCLVKEMLYIRMRKLTLNVQTDSIRAKVSTGANWAQEVISSVYT